MKIGVLHRSAFCRFFFFFIACVLVWLVLFYCSDFIRLMRKIVFVFQIFRLSFVFLFWLWYVLVCNRWDREARESEARKRKGWERNNYFLFNLYYFKGEYCSEVLQYSHCSKFKKEMEMGRRLDGFFFFFFCFCSPYLVLESLDAIRPFGSKFWAINFNFSTILYVFLYNFFYLYYLLTP